jgi:DNA replication licensing factor MCM4
MDLIMTGISASERQRRENLVAATRNLIMEKMQLGGPSMRMTEVKTPLLCGPASFFAIIISYPSCELSIVLIGAQLLEEMRKQSSMEIQLHDVSRNCSLHYFVCLYCTSMAHANTSAWKLVTASWCSWHSDD